MPSNNKGELPRTVGGQAVIEGVMMKAVNTVVAVKKPDGSIAIKRMPDKSWGVIEKIPLIRGFFVLIHSMIVGMNALSYSAKVSGDEKEEFTTKDMVFAFLFAILIAVLGFGVLPVIITKPLNIKSEFWFAFVEGIIRAVFVIVYIWGISHLKDIKRVFQYHGAEHKSVYTYEKKGRAYQRQCQKVHYASSQMWYKLSYNYSFCIYRCFCHFRSVGNEQYVGKSNCTYNPSSTCSGCGI